MDIVVLDYSTSSVHKYRVPEEMISEQVEEFIHSQGHHLSNCSWMFDNITFCDESESI